MHILKHVPADRADQRIIEWLAARRLSFTITLVERNRLLEEKIRTLEIDSKKKETKQKESKSDGKKAKTPADDKK